MEIHQTFFKEFKIKFENFNHKRQFNLLISSGYGRRETLHSNLIFNFLNANSLYLELFLKVIGVQSFDCSNALLFRELPANGYIDILIINERQCKAIIIENKIDDPGKAGQLQKYIDEIQRKYKNGVEAFYLTKYGKTPLNDYDCKHKKCLSYDEHIINWLEECIKLSSDLGDGRLRESLEIYLELVRTVINRDKYMEKVYDFLKEDNSKMSMAIDIYNSLNGRRFFDDQSIRNKIENTFSEYLENIGFEGCDWCDVKEDGEVVGKEFALIEKGIEIGSFFFDSNEIYAEFSNSNESVRDSCISGSILSDNRLKALLTNSNIEVVRDFIDNCISQMREKIINS